MPGRRKTPVYKAAYVNEWVWAHPDKPFTISRVNDAVGWAHASTRRVLNRMAGDYEQMERLDTQTFVWHSSTFANPGPDPVADGAPFPVDRLVDRLQAKATANTAEEFTVTVVARTSDVLLVKSGDDGELYRMERFTL